MNTIQPLGDRKSSNVPSIQPATSGKDDASTVKRARQEALEERRKRGEVEGLIAAIQAEKDANRAELESVRTQLAQAQDELRVQKSTIIRLSSSASSSSEIKDKLAKLVDKHEQTKVKHANELSSAQTDNKSLQSLITALQTSSTEMQQTITSLRSDKASLAQKLRSAETAPTAPPPGRISEVEAKHREERLAWRRERAQLENQLKQNEKLARRVEEVESERDAVVEERDGLEVMLGKVTVLYRMLCRDSAPIAEMREAQEEAVLMKQEARHWRSTVAEMRIRMNSLKADEADLTAQIDLLRQQMRDERQITADLLQQRSLDRSSSPIIPYPDAYTIAPLGSIDHLPYIDTILTHLSLSTLSSSTLLSHVLPTLSALQSTHTSLLTTHSTCQDTIASTRSRALGSEKALAQAVELHAGCAQQILDWRGEASRAGAQESRLRAELSDALREAQEEREKGRDMEERLKRLADVHGRGEMARTGLEDELQELRDMLKVQRDLQHKLEAAEQDRDLLQLRCHDLADELERVGQEQADLMGHTNEGQRISYMEGMRREMAIVKHELTTTRHNLNTANSRISSLVNEIASLKSLDPHSLAAPGGRIRVSRAGVRKEPEGGEVMGASMARRGSRTASSSGGGWR